MGWEFVRLVLDKNADSGRLADCNYLVDKNSDS